MHNQIFIVVRFKRYKAGGKGMVSNIATVLEPKTETRVRAMKAITSVEEIVIAAHKEGDKFNLFEKGLGFNGKSIEPRWHLVGEVEKEGLLAADFYAQSKTYKNIERFYEDIEIKRKPGNFKFNGYEIDLIPQQSVPKYIEPFLEASQKIRVKRRILISTN